MKQSVVTVATFNMHAGIDGWGRAFDYVKALSDIPADVIAVQEFFLTKDSYEKLHSFAMGRGMQLIIVPLADAMINNLNTPLLQDRGPKSWGPGGRPGRPGKVRSFYLLKRAIGNTSDSFPSSITDFDRYYDNTLTDSLFEMPRKRGIKPLAIGAVCLIFLSKLPIESYKLYRLAPLRSDMAKRCALVTTLKSANSEIEVAATHLGHITHGSLLQMRQLAGVCGQGNLPSVILGDFNCWGPPLLTALNHLRPMSSNQVDSGLSQGSNGSDVIAVNMSAEPGKKNLSSALVKPNWRRAVVKKSWPSWHPHSQVDHILINGLFTKTEPVDLHDFGSDHLPLAGKLFLEN